MLILCIINHGNAPCFLLMADPACYIPADPEVRQLTPLSAVHRETSTAAGFVPTDKISERPMGLVALLVVLNHMP